MEAEIYDRHGINFESLTHLNSIGLIQLQPLGFKKVNFPKNFSLLYYARPLTLEMPKDTGNELKIGIVMLTSIGRELAQICGSQPVGGVLGVCQRAMEGVFAGGRNSIELRTFQFSFFDSRPRFFLNQFFFEINLIPANASKNENQNHSPLEGHFRPVREGMSLRSRALAKADAVGGRF